MNPLNNLRITAEPVAAATPANGGVLRVLLAEDNATNQKLAVAILTKRGHAVVVAGNGRMAYEAFLTGGFDLVLMDMQMPEMDGLEATVAIREHEKKNGRRIPIIALTANALVGDRERCVATGMDDYLTKPLRPDELFAKITALTSRAAVAPAAVVGPVIVSPVKSEAIDLQVYDRAATLHQIGDDAGLLEELIGVFLEQLPALIPPVEDAVRRRDAKAIRQAAHAIASSASVLTTPRAKDSARRLEMLGHNDDLAHADAALAELRAELDLLKKTLANPSARKAA